MRHKKEGDKKELETLSQALRIEQLKDLRERLSEELLAINARLGELGA